MKRKNMIWFVIAICLIMAGAVFFQIMYTDNGQHEQIADEDYSELQQDMEEEALELTFPTFGEPVSLGDATLVSMTQGAAVGKDEIYFGTNGSPAVFYAIDAFTGEVNFSQKLPGEDVIWAVTIGSDQNVYVAGTQTGRLYRYIPESKQFETIGTNPSNRWVWDLDASPDGKIYGSTYSNQGGKAFVYDIASNEFTDLGIAKEGQDYVRGGGVSGRYFYAGIGTTGHLIRYDRMTLEKTEIILPVTGENSSISNIFAYGGKLFVISGSRTLILDEETHEVLHFITNDSGMPIDAYVSPPSPDEEDLVYFRSRRNSRLYTYNTATDEFKVANGAPILPNELTKGMGWIQLKDGPNAGRHVLAVVTQELHVTLYDPVEGTTSSYVPDGTRTGINIQSLEIGPDGNLYMGGYQGAMSVYDPQREQFILQEKEPHQIEGIGFLNDKVYFGIYGGAIIYEFDPNKEYNPILNPRIAYDIQNRQSRPFTFASGDNKLFIGTVADYGLLSGALTVHDADARTWKEYPNIVPNQSVIGLAYLDGKVYGGTSIWGGLGVEPTEAEAKLFEWDVAAEKVTYADAPPVPDFTPLMIGELSIGSDGNVWGIMWGSTPSSDNAFALFVMDPETKQLVKSRIMNTGARASSWRPFFMRWGEDGMLYTTLGRELHVFHPETLESQKLLDTPVHLMDLGPDGSIYYASGAQLMKLPRIK